MDLITQVLIYLGLVQAPPPQSPPPVTPPGAQPNLSDGGGASTTPPGN